MTLGSEFAPIPRVKYVLPILVAVVCALTACKTTSDRFDLFAPNRPQGPYTERSRGMTLAGRYNHQSTTYTYPVREGLLTTPPPAQEGVAPGAVPPATPSEVTPGIPPTSVPGPGASATIIPGSTAPVITPSAGSQPFAVPPPVAPAPASTPAPIPGLSQ